MPHAIIDGLSLADASGYIIIGAIIASLVLGIGGNLLIRARYAALEHALERSPYNPDKIAHPVVNRIVHEAREAAQGSREVNTQAIIEDAFQSEFKGLLLIERFVRSATGLVIILGLVGTFYGLTLSIGRLAGLVSAEAKVDDVGRTLTAGLTQTLSGMSVAFSTSLFGIVSAILLTVVGIFSNVTDHRTALMIRIETYVDRLLSKQSQQGESSSARTRAWPQLHTEEIEHIVAGFGESVARLEGAVRHFDSALTAFASSTRDFREFNLHLKDNVQRMSLSFGDFSETLKTQVGALKSKNGS